MNFLYSFRTENKFNSHEKVYKDHDYCHMVIPEKDKIILIYKQERKSLKTPLIIYAHTELLPEKFIHKISIQKNLLP